LIIAINVNKERGPKKGIQQAEFVVDHGIKGDYHAGPGIRQVSLLAQESYDSFKYHKLCLKHGAFGENIVTKGIVLHKLAVGTRLRCGDVQLVVSKIGKECHAPCIIAKTTGDCIMPREGIFATVKKGGLLRPGMIIELE